MKYDSLAIRATTFEAYLTGGKITLLQGNTYENAILHHINERPVFTPGKIEKELFPFLPTAIGEKLLSDYASDGKLIEWNGHYQTPANWRPEASLPAVPENSIVKVKFLQIGNHLFPIEAYLENQRRPGRDSTSTEINGFYSTPLNGRSGYSVNFENCSFFEKKECKNEEIRLEFGKGFAVLYAGKKEITRFTGIELTNLLPEGANLEEGTLRCEIESQFDSNFLQPFKVEALQIGGIDFALNQPISLIKIPNSPLSAIHALLLLISDKSPKDAEGYKLLVSQIWKIKGATWGFEKEEVFPGGFPSFQTYNSLLEA